MEDENFAVPPEQFFKHVSASSAKVNTYGQAQLAAALESCEKTVTQPKDSSERYERRNEDNASVAHLRCEECINLLS